MMNNSAIGGTWEELQKELFTPEEITASNLRVSLMRKPEELSGIKQPIIARMEKNK